MERERVFKMITEKEYAEVYITFKQNSNQDVIVRNGIIRPIIQKYGGKSMDVMSIGAGVGWLEDEIIRHPDLKVNRMLAIEPNPKHAKKLREKAENWLDTFYEIDSAEFDEFYETTKRFDVILIVHTLYYIRNPIGAVIKAKSFLKPEGKIMIVIRGKEGGSELTSYINTQVELVQPMYVHSLEDSDELVKGLVQNKIKCCFQNFTDHFDVTDFIERKDTPTCNDIISFFLQTKYENLDKETSISLLLLIITPSLQKRLR